MAITTVRNDALTPSTDLVQAGAVFNDATRLLDGGLWDTPADSNNQIAYLGMYTTDIHAVLNDINGMLANPGAVTVGGAAFNLADADTAVLTQVQGQLQTLLTLANGSVGNSATAATNQELIHTTQTSILNEINGDAALANALAGATYAGGTGADNAGFQALPTGADDAAALAKATAAGATLQDIGSVFNAAASLAVGGLNQTNLGQFDTDMKAILAGLTNIANNADAVAQINQAAGLTGVDAATTKLHLDTVIEQINGQINNFDPEYATNPNVAARATNDNLLDIIDIIQGDAALNAAAGGNGAAGNIGGFSEMPAYLSGTITRFQDDQAQTNFWASFVAEGNVINDQLNNVAAGNNTTPGELQALITEIQNYQQSSAAFDHSQGGVFGARFDNELLGGTLNADTNNAIHGLQGILAGDTGDALAADQAQIQAAGAGFVADAGDVSGNNIPLGGGEYVGDSRTVEGATSVPGVAQGTIPVGAPPATGGGTGGQANGGGQGNGNGGNGGQGGGNGGQGNGNGGQANNGGQNGHHGHHGHHNAGGQSAGDGDDGQVAQGGGQANNGGHGNHNGGGQSSGDDDDGQVAQGGNNGGQTHAGHGCCGGHSADHSNHGAQPTPSFWNHIETELTQHGFSNQEAQHLVQLMWHHA